MVRRAFFHMLFTLSLQTKILAQTEGAHTQNSAESKSIPGCKIT